MLAELLSVELRFTALFDGVVHCVLGIQQRLRRLRGWRIRWWLSSISGNSVVYVSSAMVRPTSLSAISPIYAMGVAQDQTTGFANFRYDYFYDHSAKDPTTVAPGAPGAPVPVTTSTASSNTVSLGGTGRPCTALSASNVLGAKDGICINHDKEGQCPSGAASDGAPCSPISEICCVHQANAKTVINEAVKAEIKAEKAA
ncbi:uncharacterized protein LOC129601596 [Paramacrobiotus metropolitanus]|uniref:uncharacterized protein LOC129601596 n=1 Tax=Paramacrobiotus metropolitanus TaxID=2943436 RepID=UPI0024463C17|nr:uncharacterized protein LOC129601596 [Paramacrobiotus metropolitanus]